MKTDPDTKEEKSLTVRDMEPVPEELSILPIKNQVAFPGLNMTLAISKSALGSLDKVVEDNRIVGIVGVKEQTDKIPGPEQIRGTGTAVRRQNGYPGNLSETRYRSKTQSGECHVKT